MLNPSDDHHWMQMYQQHIEIDSQGDHHRASSANIHEYPVPIGDGEFSGTPTEPAGNRESGRASGASKSGGVPSPKPIRRRSRASKKTPTTVLNASANNFRALVQQFTGCPAGSTGLSSKGPVNLSFSSYHPPQDSVAVNNVHPYRQQQPVAPQITYPQRGSSSLYSFSNNIGAATDGFASSRQSSMEMETAVSLDEGFAAMGGNTTSVLGHGLPTTPGSFSW